MTDMIETPTQTIVAAANRSTVLPSSIGDVTVRKLSPVEQLRFKKVIGKFYDNLGYQGDAMMAASVRQIGEFPMPFPVNEAGVEMILEKLGEEGWEAVLDHYQALAMERLRSIDDAKN